MLPHVSHVVTATHFMTSKIAERELCSVDTEWHDTMLETGFISSKKKRKEKEISKRGSAYISVYVLSEI